MKAQSANCLGRACMGVRHARKSVRLKGGPELERGSPAQEHARLLMSGAAAGTMTRTYNEQLLRLEPKAAGRPVHFCLGWVWLRNVYGGAGGTKPATLETGASIMVRTMALVSSLPLSCCPGVCLSAIGCSSNVV